MIVALLNVYLVLLFVLVKLKIVPFNLFWKVSPVIVLLLLIRPVHPDGLGCAAGTGAGGAQFGRDRAECRRRGDRGSGPGQQPLKAGDVLFRIDPVPVPGAGWGDRGAAQIPASSPGEMTQLQSAAPAGPSMSSSGRPRSSS